MSSVHSRTISDPWFWHRKSQRQSSEETTVWWASTRIAEQEVSGNFSVNSNTVAFIRSKALMKPNRGIQLVKNHSGGSSFLMHSFMTSAKKENFCWGLLDVITAAEKGQLTQPVLLRMTQQRKGWNSALLSAKSRPREIKPITSLPNWEHAYWKQNKWRLWVF